MKAIKNSRGGINPRIFLFNLIIATVVTGLGLGFVGEAEAENAYDLLGNEREFAQISLVDEVETGMIRSSYSSSFTPAPVYYSSTPVAAQNSISILGRNIGIVDSSTTNWTPDNLVARYKGGRFYYAHNKSYIFGGLAGLPVGSTFTIFVDGEVQNYVIMENFNIAKEKIQMQKVVKAINNGTQYSISLMTCAGQMLGGGDATERTLVFANRI